LCERSCSKEVVINQTIAVERVDHIGIRVRDLDRALNFYRLLGFELLHQADGDNVAIIRNENGVELNLIFNANAGEPNTNVLMDAPDNYPGYTHMALRVTSIPATIGALKANDISITQGPVSIGESGHVSVFVRDPDRNVIELRSRRRRQRRCAAADPSDEKSIYQHNWSDAVGAVDQKILGTLRLWQRQARRLSQSPAPRWKRDHAQRAPTTSAAARSHASRGDRGKRHH
jgi:lactoylglutathione lyase